LAYELELLVLGIISTIVSSDLHFRRKHLPFFFKPSIKITREEVHKLSDTKYGGHPSDFHSNTKVSDKEYSKRVVVLPDTFVNELGWKEGIELEAGFSKKAKA
jgi:hypothetical protein